MGPSTLTYPTGVGVRSRRGDRYLVLATHGTLGLADDARLLGVGGSPRHLGSSHGDTATTQGRPHCSANPRRTTGSRRDRQCGIRGASSASGGPQMRASTDSVGFRIRSARGHLDGVLRMVEEDRYCIDVLHQLSAVQGALDRVRRDILEAHLRGCVPEAVAGGRVDDVVEELLAAAFGGSSLSPPEHHCRHQRISMTSLAEQA